MPRRAKGPRLYLDQRRGQWVIRDGAQFVRTGCAKPELVGAEKFLGQYITSKYKPAKTDSPSIVDVLLVYAQEVVPSKLTKRNMSYNIGNLQRWWGGKRVVDITGDTCREYAAWKANTGAIPDLKRLQAAVNHWHANKCALAVVPKVVLPKPPPPRERWLTVKEAARLLHAARRVEYLKRLILICLHTGSRPGVALALQWDWVDLDSRLMHRRAPGTADPNNKRAPPVRIGRKLLAHMRRWKAADAGRVRFMVNYNGRQIDDPHASWDRAVKVAKLDGKVTPHTLRHTRATWLMQRGGDMWKVASHLGMTVKTLESVYGHHHPDYQGGIADL